MQCDRQHLVKTHWHNFEKKLKTTWPISMFRQRQKLYPDHRYSLLAIIIYVSRTLFARTTEVELQSPTKKGTPIALLLACLWTILQFSWITWKYNESA